MKIHCLLYLFMPLYPCMSFSQDIQKFALYREDLLLYEKYLNSKECNIHTSVKPLYNTSAFKEISDSIRKNAWHIDSLSPVTSSDEKKNKGSIEINGLFSSQFGYEQTDKFIHKNILEGGLSLDAIIKDKLFFNAAFISGNSSFPSYIDTFISNTNVVPEMGSAYYSKSGYSYQYYSGYLSFSPNKIFNFQIGKDRHFWGDGYRSLFLSDVSNSFPFLKISTTIWKLSYVNLFTWMKDATNSSGIKKDFLNKYGTFHYLSLNVTKRINLGLFESIIWQGTDSNRTRKFDLNYLNPVIFYRPVEFSLGSSDNVIMGLSFKIKVAQKQQVYGQIILDEFLLNEIISGNGWWGNKHGAQLGFKNFDLFAIKNFIFQTEVNAVRPYTYSHGSVQQNFAHYNQPLAHPLGANFAESVSFINYRYKKWSFETEFLYAVYGKDMDGKNWGQNIFESYDSHPQNYGNKFFQGLKTSLLFSKIKIAYYIIPSADLLAEAGIAVRQEKNFLYSLNSDFFFIGIKMGMRMNRYDDF